VRLEGLGQPKNLITSSGINASTNYATACPPNQLLNCALIYSSYFNRSQDSAVAVVTGYRLDDRGVGVPSPGRVKNFVFSTSSTPALRSTQPPIQWVSGAPSSGVKRQGREADHSPAASAEVKKRWIYTSTPPYVFMA
jgi:hypothetical protein